MIDGKPYNMVSFEWGGSVFLDGCYWVRTEGFYICPLSGVLKYEKKAAKRKDNPFSGVVGLSLREIDSMLAEARRSGKWPKFGPIPNTHPEKKTLDSHTLLRGWLFGWKRVKVKGEYVNARIYNEKKECIGRKKTWVPPKIEWIPHECTDGKGPCIVDENVRVRLRA
jgi:hypothetical protein